MHSVEVCSVGAFLVIVWDLWQLLGWVFVWVQHFVDYWLNTVLPLLLAFLLGLCRLKRVSKDVLFQDVLSFVPESQLLLVNAWLLVHVGLSSRWALAFSFGLEANWIMECLEAKLVLVAYLALVTWVVPLKAVFIYHAFICLNCLYIYWAVYVCVISLLGVGSNWIQRVAVVDCIFVFVYFATLCHDAGSMGSKALLRSKTNLNLLVNVHLRWQVVLDNSWFLLAGHHIDVVVVDALQILPMLFAFDWGLVRALILLLVIVGTLRDLILDVLKSLIINMASLRQIVLQFGKHEAIIVPYV